MRVKDIFQTPIGKNTFCAILLTTFLLKETYSFRRSLLITSSAQSTTTCRIWNSLNSTHQTCMENIRWFWNSPSISMQLKGKSVLHCSVFRLFVLLLSLVGILEWSRRQRWELLYKYLETKVSRTVTRNKMNTCYRMVRIR